MANWYDGDNAVAYLDLITGTRTRTATQLQNHELWEISEEIRASTTLSALMKEHEGADFFNQLEHSEEGRAVLARMYGRRGRAQPEGPIGLYQAPPQQAQG